MLNIPLMSNNITREDINVVVDFLKNSDIFTQNQNVREFEEQWSKWLGVKHSVFVNSGASANYITMMAIAEKFGVGEVIVPTITWSSDISSVIIAGHTPVFVDVNFSNLAMVEDEIIDHISDNTRAVFLTHVLGLDGLSDRLIRELEKRNVLLIEDVCESHGVVHNGRKAGSFGYASNFSFYYAHHMSTIEGGMICTNDDDFYQLLRMYRSHGLLRENSDSAYKKKIEVERPDLNAEFVFMIPGLNMRSTELNAVIGKNQIKRLDNNIIKRRNNFEMFIENLRDDRYFKDFNLVGNSNYAMILILKDQDDELFSRVCQRLRDENVEFRRGTAGGGNITRQPFVQKRFPNLIAKNYKNADHIHFYGLYTGNYPDLTKDRILGLTDILNSI